MPIKIGAPKKYPDHKLFKSKVQRYFNSISRDVPLTKSVNMEMKDKKGNNIYVDRPVLDNLKKPIILTEFVKEPGIVGLCNYLSITRDTLIEYEKREEFIDTISRARQIILERKLERVNTVKNPRGIMFDLSANYGMHEKVKQELSGGLDIPIVKFGK